MAGVLIKEVTWTVTVAVLELLDCSSSERSTLVLSSVAIEPSEALIVTLVVPSFKAVILPLSSTFTILGSALEKLTFASSFKRPTVLIVYSSFELLPLTLNKFHLPLL